MEWQWWVSQGFALAGLVFIVIAMQQKTATKLLWFRVIGVTLIVAGLCFLGTASAIILGAAGLVQLFVALLFAYKPKTDIRIKWVVWVLLGISIVALNVVFWGGYLSIMAIAYGIAALVVSMLKSASLMRVYTIPICVLGIVYYGLLLAPINAVMELIALLASVVGILRLDRNKSAAASTEPATSASADADTAPSAK